MTAVVPGRLRAGEWGVLAGSLALVGSLALPWGAGGRRGGACCGWRALARGRLSVTATAAGGILLAWLQASCRGPAAPVSATTMLLPLSVANAVIVSAAAGARCGRPDGRWLALIGALAVPAGAYRSLRQDGIRAQDGPSEVELVSLAPWPPPPAA